MIFIFQHSRLIAVIEALDNGKSIRETRDADVQVVIRHLYHYAGWAELMAEGIYYLTCSPDQISTQF